MNSTVKHKVTTFSQANNQRLTRNDKVLYSQIDHQLLRYFPERTETEDDLYEFQLFQRKEPTRHQIEDISSSQAKKNIELTMILVTQNDEIQKKIEEIKRCMEQEELKTTIFKKKIADNQKTIESLQAKKEKFVHESQKIKTLNESSIPNKSLEMNTTGNTNAWINQFLSKSELQGLWAAKSKEQKATQPKVKSYTIDLSNFMNSARLKSEKSNQKAKASCSKIQEDRIKPKNATLKVAPNRAINKSTIKNEISQKQRLLNKNLAQLRNIKKSKHNPQL